MDQESIDRRSVTTRILEQVGKDINLVINHNKNISQNKLHTSKKIKSKSRAGKINNKELHHNGTKRNTTGSKNTKSQIIKNILEKKREELEYSENKSKVKTSIKKRKLKSKKKNINKKFKENDDEFGLENDLPLPMRSSPHVRNKQVILPEISTRNWNIFRKEMEKKKTHENDQIAKKCLDRMHSYRMFDLHHSALYFLRQAIVDSLLNRKWDNLVKLLVMLIKNYSDPVFTVFIRHMCQILKYYHPRIKGTDLEVQIELIMEKYEKVRNKRHNVTNDV